VDDAYQALGLAPDATAEQIGRAYRTLVRRYPPELNPERFARIHHAYELLRSLAHIMDDASQRPEAALEALFPPPAITLRAAPPPPGPPRPEDVEPLLRPLMRRAIERLLREAFAARAED
jgi:curved DNA-binding protein CbpA